MPVREVGAGEALELVDGDAVLLDVREEYEWEAGRAPMATWIPLAELPDRLDQLPHDQLIVCVCRAGTRSMRAARFLDEGGFTTANLTGGMLAWLAEDLPLESDDDEPTIE